MSTQVRNIVEEAAREARERMAAEALAEKFAEVGILAMYGGGARSKGHGFWLRATTQPDIAEWKAAKGFCAVNGVTLHNSGQTSGNESFWMFEDAENLLNLILSYIWSDEYAKSLTLRGLTCCCCGEPTIGRQWHNRDKGYGICSRCVNWIQGRVTPEEFKQCYGREGFHYNTC